MLIFCSLVCAPKPCSFLNFSTSKYTIIALLENILEVIERKFITQVDMENCDQKKEFKKICTPGDFPNVFGVFRIIQLLTIVFLLQKE